MKPKTQNIEAYLSLFHNIIGVATRKASTLQQIHNISLPKIKNKQQLSNRKLHYGECLRDHLLVQKVLIFFRANDTS
jgi:hypothetical protein